MFFPFYSFTPTKVSLIVFLGNTAIVASAATMNFGLFLIVIYIRHTYKNLHFSSQHHDKLGSKNACRYAHIMRCHDINMTKVAVVTGSSSGIGYETSLLLARNQFTTYATMRNMNKSDRVREIALKENIPGKEDEKKPNEYHTEDYGTLYSTTITGLLSDVFGATTKHGRKGNILIFDPDIIEKLSKTIL